MVIKFIYIYELFCKVCETMALDQQHQHYVQSSKHHNKFIKLKIIILHFTMIMWSIKHVILQDHINCCQVRFLVFTCVSKNSWKLNLVNINILNHKLYYIQLFISWKGNQDHNFKGESFAYWVNHLHTEFKCAIVTTLVPFSNPFHYR